ncbi:MAG: hypothetical protein PVI86_13320 [Phycisphaerae bacterium]|jgi:hypothetical protein
MNTVKTRVLGGVALVLLAGVGVARAGEVQPLPPLAEEHQALLMERFGDDGIDADGDGTVTHEEARAFFMERHGDVDAHPGFGPGAHRFGPCGGKAHGAGGFHRLGRTLHHLRVLEAATPPEHFTIERHGEADLDEDGELSDEEWQAFAAARREEILARMAERIPDADVDEDGTLSADELDVITLEFLARLLERHPDADADGDGMLSEEEARAFHEARFEEHRAIILERHPEADLDGDGTLSNSELHEFLADRPGRGGPFGMRRFGRLPGPAQRERLLTRHPEADVDGDGTLSDDELHELHTRFGGPRGPRGNGPGGWGMGRR